MLIGRVFFRSLSAVTWNRIVFLRLGSVVRRSGRRVRRRLSRSLVVFRGFFGVVSLTLGGRVVARLGVVCSCSRGVVGWGHVVAGLGGVVRRNTRRISAKYKNQVYE